MDKTNHKESLLTQHLKSVGESYFEHMRNALYFSRNCGKAFLGTFIHSIFPFICTTTGSSTVRKLYEKMTVKAEISKVFTSQDKHVAIVGFGVAGLLSFMNLVKNYQPSQQKFIIRIFEKSRSAPKGIAYSTKNPHHLLNVPAAKMGVVDEDREHFFKWLVSNGYSYKKDDFVPRQIFGIYLEDVMETSLKLAEQKGIICEFIDQEISEISVKNGIYVIGANAHNYCILATGSIMKNPNQNFWNIDLEKFLRGEEIHIIGCGLTGFDAAISLRDLNYSGKIFMHSRTGKTPQPHKLPQNSEKEESPLILADAGLPLSEIFHKFVAACRKSPNWRLCFDAFRPLTQKFWMALDTEKKKRFMRLGFRIWNTHRHRCPESQFRAIEEMVNTGKLEFSREKPVGKIIDCTGFDYGTSSKLVQNLLDNGVVELDEMGLGIKSKLPNLHIMSGLNFGSKFEITAVPDITPQAKQVANAISG